MKKALLVIGGVAAAIGIAGAAVARHLGKDAAVQQPVRAMTWEELEADLTEKFAQKRAAADAAYAAASEPASLRAEAPKVENPPKPPVAKKAPVKKAAPAKKTVAKKSVPTKKTTTAKKAAPAAKSVSTAKKAVPAKKTVAKAPVKKVDSEK